MINNLLLVGLGGAAGSMLRFGIQRLGNQPAFPYGTLLVNITGCLLIGIFWGLLTKINHDGWMKFLVMTGFCGGFTTFSAFTVESLQLMTANKWLPLATYLTASIIGGLAATFIGYKIIS